MSRYAEGTRVEVTSSQSELQRLLVRRGARAITTGWDAEAGAYVEAQLKGMAIRLAVPAPDLTRLRREHPRTDLASLREQEERRMWRALLLLVKAKLEAIDSGLSTIQREFLADLVLSDGGTVFDRVMVGLSGGLLLTEGK